MIGVAFIILGSISSISSGDFGKVLVRMLIWGIIFFGAIYVFRKIKNRPQTFDNTGGLSANTTQNVVNAEKHGCKCYMDGLTEGEKEIAHILAEGLSYKDYFIFNNITIPSEKNGSSQIDHLVVSRFGIFVIESKDYKGWIFGSKEEDKWTQSLPGGKNKFQFQNPIHQNWSHIMSLKSLLPTVSENVYQSIVVFTGYCEIKTQPIENVVSSKDLVGCILKHTDSKLSEDNLHMVIGKLSYMCQTVDISLSQHIDNLRTHHSA